MEITPSNSRLENLSSEKRALLVLRALKAQEGFSKKRQGTIPRRAHGSPSPLSFAQERLWLLDQLEPGGAAYNIAGMLRIKGVLRADLLERAVNEIVRRHDILRTRIEIQGEAPMQVVEAHRILKLRTLTFEGMSDVDQEKQIEELAREEGGEPFDLAKGPFLRICLARMAEEEHVLFFTMHHIISDGWSMGVLVREFAALYEAFSQGLASPLSALPIQYGDYAAWQRERLQGPVLAQQLSYWKEHLTGTAPLELPTDRSRPAIQNHDGASEKIVINKDLLGGLNELSRNERVTLFITLSAAFKVLLGRYSGQEDVVVGVPTANRNHGETESLIGFFVNTLVLRTDLSGNPTFKELLQREREVTLGAHQNQDLPFERLVAELQLERDLGRNPLFQVMLNMLNLGDQKLSLPGLEIEEMAPIVIHSKFDLTVYVAEQENGLRFELVYKKDLFNQQRMADLLSQFEYLLQQVVSAPETKINDFSLATRRMKEWVLPQVTQKLARRWPGAVHGLFEHQAKLSPSAIAVCDAQTLWTYGQLDKASNQLANYLRAQGIGLGDRVAIGGRRKADLVLALLGVLKAGGSFLILDPAYPPSRLIEYIRAAKPRALLELNETTDSNYELNRATSINCSKWLEQYRTYPDTGPDLAVEPDQEAYVAFTSGSAGKPKGIIGTHLPPAHFVKWQAEEFGLHKNDRFSLFSGLSHDPLLRDIFTPLSLGAQLYNIPPEHFLEYDHLASWVNEKQISVMHLTPALGQLLILKARQGQHSVAFTSLRYAFFGGDILTESIVGKFSQLASSAQCVNFYGATETPQAMAYFRIPKSEGGRENRSGTIPLGKGIEGVNLVVVNKSNGLAGVGEMGEICVRTPYLSKGYIETPILTSERFQGDWFGNDSDTRLYRTGDWGRYLPDGNVEFCGRKDRQMKIRGFRIEPGEVESILQEHSSVRQVSIMGRTDESGENQFVAYVVLKGGSPTTSSELKAFLKERLPEYMLPVFFVFLDRLPLTPNGKVDEKALPPPDISKAIQADRPRTPTEELMAAIWKQMLGIERVGVSNNFFEMGGHSLLAMRLISRVRDVFGIELPLRSLFEAPTVAQLSERVENARQKGLKPAPGIVGVDHQNSVPVSYGQERLWILDQMEPDTGAYNMIGAVSIKGGLDRVILEKGISAMIARHEILRTTFEMKDGQLVQMIHSDRRVEIESEELGKLASDALKARIQEIGAEEARKPFDLAKGPLIRVRLASVGDSEQILFYTMHHIVSDGWSNRVLAREFGCLYDALAAGQPSVLSPMPIQYADYSIWQRGWLKGDVLDQQLAYWKKQLTGMRGILELPADRARLREQSHRGAAVEMVLPPKICEGLKRLSQQEGVTLFITLAAAFKVLLHRHTGEVDISVGSPIANRRQTETENLIGFFVNTIVLRTDLSGNPTFFKLLQREREVALGAFEHQDIPFEQLVQELHPDRTRNQSPLFQVFYNMMNIEEAELKLGGLQTQVIPVGAAQAKFDLSFYVRRLGPELKIEFVYKVDLFERKRIVDMLDQFVFLLDQIVAEPAQKVGEYSLVTASMKQRLPDLTRKIEPQWNGAVHALFSRMAHRNQSAVAISQGTEIWSYAELEQRSNQLARHLHTQGIGLQERVVICATRGATLVLGVLGVLKAGASFVILDPAYPHARLTEYVRLAQPKALIFSESATNLQSELWLHSKSCECPSITLPEKLEDVRRLLEGWPLDFQLSATGPEQECYLAFTSGTTGTPKAIIGTHRPLAHFIEWHAREFRLAASDRFSLLSGLSHDPLLRDIFAPLSIGAAICIPNDNTLTQGELATWLQEAEISVMHLTPALGRLLDATARNSRQPVTLPYLRYAFFGGDLLTRGDVQQLREISPAVECVNFYGATETPQAMSFYRVPSGAAGWCQTSWQAPIGSGIEGVDVIVLNSFLKPAGVGEIGEIWIRTPYLSRGYLNNSAATLECYHKNWFCPAGEDRLYRTGDLGRHRPDGNIEFCGRRDQQVKVRGFRVECGEIECALRQYPGVGDATVVARNDDAGQTDLIAYVVAVPEPTPRQLRNHLREKLPEYMMPRAFVMLNAMPLTPSGKVDLKALSADLETGKTGVVDGLMSPTEELVASIWQELLKVKAVARHEHFFDLGGHSLLAIQVISRIRNLFAIELPLMALFDAPTVSGLSGKIDAAQKAATGLTSPPLVKVGRNRDLPLSFAQERLWLLDQIDPDFAMYNLPKAIAIEGPVRVEVIEQTLNEILRRHEILRTTYTTVGGQPVQQISPIKHTSLPVVNLSALSPQEQKSVVAQLIEKEAKLPFNLKRDFLLRFKLLTLDSNRHVLLCTLHHIASDGWSVGILIREFEALYGAFAEGRPSLLPELPVQYADYAVWQREWLQGKILDSHLAYWKGQLGGKPPALRLRSDHERSPVKSSRLAKQPILCSAVLTRQLKLLSRKNDITLFMVLLSAFKALLSLYTRQKDIVVGTFVANRHPREVEPLIGFFVNHLMLYTDLSNDPDLADIMARVKTVTLGAYAHQDLPFQKLVAELQPEQRMSHSPLYEVMFVLHNTDLPQLKLPGLVVTPMEADWKPPYVSLACALSETPDGIQGALEYDPALFKTETIEILAENYHAILEQFVQDPSLRLSSLKVSESLTGLCNRLQPHEQKPTVVIAATFTADPVEKSLAFWINELEIPVKVEFAPYNQVFQQFLDVTSLQSRNEAGINVALIRIEDLQRHKSMVEDELRGQVLELVAAIKAAAARSSRPNIVGVCPRTVNSPHENFLATLENLLVTELAGVKSVSLIRSNEWEELYPVAACYDRYSDELGHIPYTQDFYTAMGTGLARKIFAFLSTPIKVIAIDCDHTLWTGNCGEDGADGIVIDAPRRKLQRFLALQKQAGALLCICSKNAEGDVMEVFQSRSEMCLNRQDIVAWRINWKPKSKNLKSLAEELGVSLDSFVFIDDSPMECAEVEAHCPEIMAVQLPAAPEIVGGFLERLWLFDRSESTEEDRKRTQFYQQNRDREQLRAESPTLEAFLAGLELRVQIAPMRGEQLSRVAQLTQRTNQFNTTAIRRREHELEQLLQSNILECLVVEAQDRFGDYGLIGAMLIEMESDGLRVDSLLLSCRVLGKGIEHRMLARLGEMAAGQGLQTVNVVFRASEKNLPALDFLKSVSEQLSSAGTDEGIFRFEANDLKNLVYVPAGNKTPKVEAQAINHTVATRKVSSRVWTRVGLELFQVGMIRVAMESAKNRRTGQSRDYKPPRTPIEEILAKIWAEALGLERVGVEDDFFALGGHSLMGSVILTRVRDTFQVELPLRHLFETPTVAGVATVIARTIVSEPNISGTDSAKDELQEMSEEELDRLILEERAKLAEMDADQID